VVISGAASGIGAATAAELSDRGWIVAGLDLSPSRWESSTIVDMSNPDAVTEALADVERRLGPVEAVVSAAGHYEMLPFGDIPTDRWHAMLRVHLGGLLHLTRAVVPGMRDRGRGSIVAVTSELAIGGGDGDAHYAAAKGAVIGFVRSLAAELAAWGVRVNGVAPGPTDTPMLAADSPWRAPDYLQTLPLRRLVVPEEIAQTIAYLVEEAPFVTGEIVSPNAGAVI
jgi:NAD(P)-dependent dehydrogenase (short-subunit alcohol dehydrogenase family)